MAFSRSEYRGSDRPCLSGSARCLEELFKQQHDPPPFLGLKNLQNLSRIPLSFASQSCSVSTRVTSRGGAARSLLPPPGPWESFLPFRPRSTPCHSTSLPNWPPYDPRTPTN